MDVVRDVLDKSVVDRNGHEMGRVDGVLLEQTAGEQPRLDAILIGPAALGSRLHARLGMLVSALERRFGIVRDQPVQIDFADIAKIDRRIHLRLTIGETAVGAFEQKLRVWLMKLPGNL